MDTLPPPAQKGKTTFIYRLIDPSTLQIRYVGKADNPIKRLATHLHQASHDPTDRHYQTHKANWLRSLLRVEQKPILEIVEEVPVEKWKEREVYWIAFYRAQGFDLTNATIGGDGADGLVHSAETRKKIALSSRGRKMSEKTRQRMREIGKIRGVSEIARQKSIESLSGKHRPHSEETKRKIGEANKGKVRTEEDKRKNSDAHKGKTYSEETRNKVRSARLGKKASQESRQRMSDAAKLREAKKRQNG